jgi:hypothetical protein
MKSLLMAVIAVVVVSGCASNDACIGKRKYGDHPSQRRVLPFFSQHHGR